jgi:hypothetical protein
MHAALTVKVMKAAASSSHERRADAGPSLNILSVALPSPFHAGGHSAFFNAADIMSKAVLPARMILPWPTKPWVWSEKCRCDCFAGVPVNFKPTCALTPARAGWQPATTGKMDAADFAGFWLRQQRIGTRSI